jgi:hypothetical protein
VRLKKLDPKNEQYAPDKSFPFELVPTGDLVIEPADDPSKSQKEITSLEELKGCVGQFQGMQFSVCASSSSYLIF